MMRKTAKLRSSVCLYSAFAITFTSGAIAAYATAFDTVMDLITFGSLNELMIMYYYIGATRDLLPKS